MKLQQEITDNMKPLWKDLGDGVVFDKEFVEGLEQHYNGVILEIAKEYAREVLDHIMENADQYIDTDEYGAHYKYEEMDALKKELQ